MSHVQSVVPAGTAPRNHLLAFSALAQALVDMEACAIARYVKNDEGLGGVKLGALFPLIENVGGGSASNSRLREVSFLFCQVRIY